MAATGKTIREVMLREYLVKKEDYREIGLSAKNMFKVLQTGLQNRYIVDVELRDDDVIVVRANIAGMYGCQPYHLDDEIWIEVREVLERGWRDECVQHWGRFNDPDNFTGCDGEVYVVDLKHASLCQKAVEELYKTFKRRTSDIKSVQINYNMIVVIPIKKCFDPVLARWLAETVSHKLKTVLMTNGLAPATA